MPESNANEDPPRLNGFGSDEPFEVPKLRLRFMPRTRALASEGCFRARRKPVANSRAKRAARRACPLARAGATTALASCRRRRLWATCRERGSGSPS